MINTAVLVLCIFGLLHTGSGQAIVVQGQCNPSEIQTVTNFNANNYLGQWFEVERYPQPWQFGQCASALYTQGAEGVVNVLNTEVVSQALSSQSGTARVVSNGRLEVTFNVNGNINTADLFVLATDYTDYSLVYSCRNINAQNMEVGSWKLSRNRILSAEAKVFIDNFIANSNILNPSNYQVTGQTPNDCFYVPEFKPDEEVQVRGTCDDIRGQANFNMERFVGWWHEISRYPTGRDDGSCISTRYRQSGNYNLYDTTQVFDLTAQITNGTIDISETEDGKLTRTWTVDDNIVEEDVWVVATDYQTYSILLTCAPAENGSEYVRIWSSVQSKYRTLTPAAEEAVASAIASNNFLMEDFFVSVNQTDDACFHYPEATGASVVLPGQCDEDIPVQSDFNITSYAGTWYQIERYPYPQVPADTNCIGTRYTPNADTDVVAVLNWEVRNGLQTMAGQATVANSSLAIVYATDATKTVNLHILTTDYESYSLAYTCSNYNQFERVVVAFKLSRNRNMSANGDEAINSYMATRQELHQPYFITAPQSDDCVDPNSSFLVKSSVLIVLICYVINMFM